jgi:hypothetical protein
MAIPSSGEISMNLFNTDRGIASGTQIDLAAAGTAYAVSYTTDGSNDLQMLEFRGKASQFWTANRSGTFTRNNCSSGYVAGTATYTKTYTSYISQANANSLASGDGNFNNEGQAYANSNGTCTLNLNATTNYGCQSNVPGKGYINVQSYSGGTGSGYRFRYKLESADDSTYSNWIYGNSGSTGAVLTNGAWMIQIQDSAGNIVNKYGYAISCNYPSLTATVTSGGTYSGEAYIRVTNASGGSGAGYYWYLSTDATQRAIDGYALNLANGEYIVYLADNGGNSVSFNPITFNLPPAPNELEVRFREGSTAPTNTNGGCDVSYTNITVEMPQDSTFENASTFISSYFTSYPTSVVIGYLIYNGRYVPIGKGYGGTTTAQPFGSRANCPTQVPAYGPVSPEEYQCVGYTKQQKYYDGNGGFTWVDVETNSTYCLYTPSLTPISLFSGYNSTDACEGFGGYFGYYIPPNESWSYATYLYSDSSGTIASAGFYSDGSIVRQWDGSFFLSSQYCNGGEVT